MAVIKNLLPLGYALTVAAHGRVSEVVVNGVSHQGYNSPAWNNNPNPPNVAAWTIQQTDLGFVAPDKFNDPDIICHRDAKPGKSTIEVAAGDILTLQWTPWPGSHHGPVIDYLANCHGPCESVDKTKLEFFKIDEVGFLDQKGPTFGDDVLIANDHKWRLQIPSMLLAGNYVLRHELIALHSAGSPNGAQAYPQCFNLKITGSGTVQPKGVKGTELYKATDPGILSNIWVPNIKYEIPGPPLMPGVPASIDQNPGQSKPAPTPVPSPPPGDGSKPPPAPAPATTLATSVRPPPGEPTTPPCKGGKKGKGKKGKGKKGKGKKPKDGQTQTLYGQCGGINWTGPTACVDGATCKVQNPWYSQCVSA
ncbi:hypothetical protein E4U42_006006 [Claviceps africana]|uniref:lytic cellulose monooxygenase (C4-dehydrogenating) n=1 Tax=Claviceps africana TaxID=83212 RepID=A0A8K0J524_9HYPO|nr:hypothetical protein E4U42_006006 [Claviceps africana]